MASDNGTDLTFSPGHSLIHVLTKYSDKTKCILVFMMPIPLHTLCPWRVKTFSFHKDFKS